MILPLQASPASSILDVPSVALLVLAVIALGFYLVIGRNRREKEIPFVPYQGEEESEHDGE